MFEAREILYFTPFYFDSGTIPKNKYFLVLGVFENEIIVASLPTSKDHVPNFIDKKHGCLNDDKNDFNCYYFECKRIISECNTFAFPVDTFVYGEQLKTIELSAIIKQYPTENINFLRKGKLSELEYANLIRCILNSKKVKRKIKSMLLLKR